MHTGATQWRVWAVLGIHIADGLVVVGTPVWDRCLQTFVFLFTITKLPRSTEIYPDLPRSTKINRSNGKHKPASASCRNNHWTPNSKTRGRRCHAASRLQYVRCTVPKWINSLITSSDHDPIGLHYWAEDNRDHRHFHYNYNCRTQTTETLHEFLNILGYPGTPDPFPACKDVWWGTIFRLLSLVYWFVRILCSIFFSERH